MSTLNLLFRHLARARSQTVSERLRLSRPPLLLDVFPAAKHSAAPHTLWNGTTTRAGICLPPRVSPVLQVAKSCCESEARSGSYAGLAKLKAKYTLPESKRFYLKPNQPWSHRTHYSQNTCLPAWDATGTHTRRTGLPVCVCVWHPLVEK